jgi:hypothetical protein
MSTPSRPGWFRRPAERLSRQGRLRRGRPADRAAVAPRALAIAAPLAFTMMLAGCGSERENHRRLHVLQRDPVLACHVEGVQPWKALDTAGTTQGVGFGGISPTLVVRNLWLTGDAGRVTAELSTCAAKAGWSVHPSTTEIVGLSAWKRFDDRWDANLDVYVGVNPFEHRPEVQINIETDPV